MSLFEILQHQSQHLLILLNLLQFLNSIMIYSNLQLNIYSFTLNFLSTNSHKLCNKQDVTLAPYQLFEQEHLFPYQLTFKLNFITQ